MNSLETLYGYAESKSIPIIPYPLPETGSMALMNKSRYYIGMDYEVFDTGAEELTHLAHELGHCETGAFYNRYAAIECRQRHENRADKWAIQTIIPKEKLDNAVSDGRTEAWELAELFGVTEEFMRKAIVWYNSGTLCFE